MKTKTVYQYDPAGMYVGPTEADESPLEPGVWLIPARCVEVEPPKVTADQWPRWNGAAWQIITMKRPEAAEVADPVAKLRDFLNSNPDVAELLQKDEGANV
jgi:hypothetical protein